MKTAPAVAAALLAVGADAVRFVCSNHTQLDSNEPDTAQLNQKANQFLLNSQANGSGPHDGLAHSPPVYPSPWMDPAAPGWADAYAKAKAFVSQLTLAEKVNITTGVGYVSHFPKQNH